MKPSVSRFIAVRGLNYHLREWGVQDAEASRTLLMLHGWMDVSASFQFVADALRDRWRIIAPDWRGYGQTDRTGSDCYWFPDYLADLDYILDAVAGSQPMVLVGHSMGGNVALMYAGVRPQRVRAVVNLEGFGLRATNPEQAPTRYAQWIDELKQGATLRDYGSLDEVASRLMQNNPRLHAERAAFLAQHWATADGKGRYCVAGDPAHRIVNPTLYRIDEVLACWQRVACPVLWVRAAQTDVLRHVGADPASALRAIEERKAALPDVESAVIENAGHMLHHDQPDEVARLIDMFLRRIETRA